MEFDCRIDTRSTRLSLAQLSDNEARQSINRCLNLAAASTTKLANAEIRVTINAKAPALRKRGLISLKKASGSVHEARIRISGKHPALTDFKGTKQVAAGLKVKVYTSGSAKVVKGAFLYPGRHGVVSVDRRRKGDKRVGRGPVKILYGPSVAQAVDKPHIIRKLEDHARDRFIIEIQRDVAFRLSRQRNRAAVDDGFRVGTLRQLVLG
ncbi:MAG: hypothetical protein ACRDKE_06355 [Solirubrobacterales bacterium]